MEQTHRHFIIHKPYGFLSQFITNQANNKNKLLGELQDFPEGTMAVGRLDATSEGLLLLTTNGKVSAHITGRKIEKEYYVQVDGLITPEAIEQLQKGVNISVEGKPYTTNPGKATVIPDPGFPPRIKKVRDDRHGPTCWVAITIKEGKFRQVRKMTAAVGFPTLRLVRYRVGSIVLDGLHSGDVKEVATLV